MTCLRVIQNYNDDSESSDEEVEVANYVASSSESDTPIIAVSRRDPSIRVEVQRLYDDSSSLYPTIAQVANDSESDNERDRLHWEYLSAD